MFSHPFPFTEFYTVEKPLGKVVYLEEKIRGRLIATLVIVFSLISSSAWTLWHGSMVAYFRYDVLLIPILSLTMKLVGALILYYLTKKNCVLWDLSTGNVTTYYKFFFTVFVKNRFNIQKHTTAVDNPQLSYTKKDKRFVLYLTTTNQEEIVLCKDKKESTIQQLMKIFREMATSKEDAYEVVS